MLPHRPLSSPIRRLIALVALGITGFSLYYYWDLIPLQYQPSRALPPTGIPKKIWYKLGPKGLSDEARNWTNTCTQKNPGYHAEFLTDASADAWVRTTFSPSRPDIVETYLGLSVPILKADFLRYLLLFAEGGMWADLDVSCGDVPIDDWLAPRHRRDAALVVGWEFDMGWGADVFHQLSSWVVLARPGSPHMMGVIEDIVDELRGIAREYGVSIAGVTMSMVQDVVDLTGPRRLTRSVFRSLQRTLGLSDDEFVLVEESTWWLREPRLVGDILFLPGFSFASSMNTYDEETHDLGQVLVEHHYAGSWKNENGGEQA
ncbi:Initiation-specific alpha-1,6-mannosyltransferase [Cytospora mali]|uniref:Initiation-specific alpha-1,6-mannosyltransferase n=1 Tax=Cytospora mali TaxID=578113 RepID=A0A194URV7_CYTMA|nr:Initiation-specific alpha-1,6-mannosyltransferase [Valsa mali var. pyri (nom. inval.)]